MVEYHSDTVGVIGSSPIVTTMKQEILDAGWEVWIPKYIAASNKREYYSKGNFALIFDGHYSYTGNPYVRLWVKDPAAYMDKVGDNEGAVCFNSEYKGKETLDAINTLFF